MSPLRRDLNTILGGKAGCPRFITAAMWFGVLDLVAVIALTARDIVLSSLP